MRLRQPMMGVKLIAQSHPLLQLSLGIVCALICTGIIEPAADFKTEPRFIPPDFKFVRVCWYFSFSHFAMVLNIGLCKLLKAKKFY